MRSVRRLLFGSVLLALACAGHALAQDEVPEPDAEEETGEAAAPPSEPLPPVYDEKLLRLAEILGSLSFLRDLCGAGDGAQWRREMQALIAAENPGPQRLGRMMGRFNHGFETFHAVYRSCTPSARQAIELYLEEGGALSAEIRSRYGQ
jgi:uncharacterized protein (TIGR02301 family)